MKTKDLKKKYSSTGRRGEGDMVWCSKAESVVVRQWQWLAEPVVLHSPVADINWEGQLGSE